MGQGDIWTQLRRQMADVEDTLQKTARRMPGLGAFMRGEYPRVDVYEGPDQLIVQAEIPGVPKEELSLSILGRTLTIQGRDKTGEYADYACHLKERVGGEFQRDIDLPACVDPQADVAAALKDGILTVTLRKREIPTGRQIDVEGS
jgi:HSP20 family protein